MFGTPSGRVKALLILVMIGAVMSLVFSKGSAGNLQASGPRLISVEPLSDEGGAQCTWVPASSLPSAGAFQPRALQAAFQQGAGSAAQAGSAPSEAVRLAASKRQPLRTIRDPNPEFSAVAVDPVRNEVVLADESGFNIMVFDRTTNTPPTAAFSEPKRRIAGPRSRITFECNVYVDPANGDIYTVSNDLGRVLQVFSRDKQGDVPANRQLFVPIGTFGLAVDEVAKELFITVQHDRAVMVFEKMAKDHDAPIRLLQGDHTGLNDPHDVHVDSKNRLLFTTNHGSYHSKAPKGTASNTGFGFSPNFKKPNWPVGESIAGTGKIFPPSITVHTSTAAGDTPPLRTIQGPKTQLNMPVGLGLDSRRNELFVANDMGQSVLVFNSLTDDGDVAPKRVLKGPRTMLASPTSVFVDEQNDELWVANYANHTVTVYRANAGGDTPPLRVIRGAPAGTPAAMLGNPGAVAFDTKRDEILVPS